MSFRKRNIGVSRTPNPSSSIPDPPPSTTSAQLLHSACPPGTRSSPIDGRLTTSTGTPHLDSILAGHAGLPLGTSLLLVENGTTDYAGALLRCYAAEGLVQGHVVYVIGAREGWARELPGVVGAAEQVAGERERGGERDRERMKIAWRYERLAGLEEGKRAPAAAVNRSPSSTGPTENTEPPPFCHTFDLSKRLTIPPTASLHQIAIPTSTTITASLFASVLLALSTSLAHSPATTPHRVLLPSLLSPAHYPPQASAPHHLIQLFHGLRALLRIYPSQLTAIASLPLDLHPRRTGLIRSLEELCDGVVELTPFPHPLDEGPALPGSGAGPGAQEEKPQGMVKVHKLPIFHERGGGGVGGAGTWADDMAFTVSRRRFVIRPFSLPPADGDSEAQRGEAGGGAGKGGLEF